MPDCSSLLARTARRILRDTRGSGPCQHAWGAGVRGEDRGFLRFWSMRSADPGFSPRPRRVARVA